MIDAQDAGDSTEFPVFEKTDEDKGFILSTVRGCGEQP